MDQRNANPLAEKQREKVGAQTFSKYAYQYHWALLRAIEEYSKSKDYAILIELHEDVVIANSLSLDKALFEFNQVKATPKVYSAKHLVELKNGSSILGKLLSSTIDRGYSAKISFINLVTLGGYNLKLRVEGLNLEKIAVNDISDLERELLELAMKNELKTDRLPDNLQFIKSRLSINYRNDVISYISDVIAEQFPGALFNSVDIYRLLIDELHLKGTVTFDFANWEELLENKALTSIKVSQVISAYTSLKSSVEIDNAFTQIADELNIKTIPRKKLKQQFNRYMQHRLKNNSTLQIDTIKTIKKLINEQIALGESEIERLLDNVALKMPQKIARQFVGDSVKAAIICEFIMLQ